MRAVAIALWGAILVAPAAHAEKATPIAVEAGQERAVFEPTAVYRLGSGPATLVAVRGDLLAVASARRFRGEAANPVGSETQGGSTLYDRPRTPWYSVNVVDIYRFGKDGSIAPVAGIPLQHEARVLQFAPSGELLVGDCVWVTAYRIDAKGKTSLAWRYSFDGLEQILFSGGGIVLRSKNGVHTVQDKGNGCVLPRAIQFLPSNWISQAVSDRYDRYLFLGRNGQAAVYYPDSMGNFHYARVLPLFGSVRGVHPLPGGRMLVLDAGLLLRVFNMGGLINSVLKTEFDDCPESFDDKRYVGVDLRARYVAGELKLTEKCKISAVIDDVVLLLNDNGRVETVELDAATGKLGQKSEVPGLADVTALSACKDRVAAATKDGSVYVFAKGTPPRLVVKPVESGPWFLDGGDLYVAAGSAIHRIERPRGTGPLTAGDLGPEVFRGRWPIIDIQRRGPTIYVLGEKELTACEVRQGAIAALSCVPTPGKPFFFRPGPEYGAVVHDDRGLTLVDLRDPAKMRVVGDLELEMPTHSEVPTKTGDHLTFYRKIRDVLVEKDRLLALGTEVYFYDLADLASGRKDVPWKQRWHRPYVSADDILYTSFIAPLGDNRYLVASERFYGTFTRAYVLTVKADGTIAWRYCRLGAGNALGAVSGADGLLFLAAGQDGFRALRFDPAGEALFLGADREPDAECQSVLLDGQWLYAKSGNTIVKYRWRLDKARENTAFAFTPSPGKMPLVTVDGLDVTSEDYRVKMGYRNKLKLVATDLSDKAGFPKTAVAQATVAVDPALGRIKFAGGRNAEPEFVARANYINVGLGCWRRMGKYHIATMSEQSQGLGVLDLSDPTCMKIVAVAGQPNWMTYPHTVIGHRNGFAYITGNMFNMLQPVNVKDPLHPHYERMINLESGGVTTMTCPTHYAGFFRGDRLYVPCTAGLVEADVSDPTFVRRVALHERAKMIHQVFPEVNRAVRWLDGRLELLDVADPANPKVVGCYPKEGKFDHPVRQTLTVDGRTYVMAAGKGAVTLFLLDCSDWSDPKLEGSYVLPKGSGAFLARGGYVYVGGVRELHVIDWRKPDAPQPCASLEEKDFLGTWRYQFLEDRPRALTIAGGDYGRDLRLETLDGNTLWGHTGGASYAIDVADPARPKVVGAGPGDGESWWICSDDSDIVSIGSYPRSFIDVSRPAAPRCIMEYYKGHPFEVGWPCEGAAGMFQVGSTTVRKWRQDPRDGLFHCDEDVVYPAWFGIDPDFRWSDRPMCLLAGAEAGGNSTTVRSAPIAVQGGETLIFQGVARTVGYPDRLHVFDRSRTYDNEKRSSLQLFLRLPDGKTSLATISKSESDGVVYGFQHTLVVPKSVTEITVDLMATGYAWVSDLRILRGQENLLQNGNFDQPPDPSGVPAGWRGVRAAATGSPMSFADERALYCLLGNDLFLYDLEAKKKLPVSKIAVQVHPTSDSPAKVYVRKEGPRRIAYVVTYQGLVTLDVTDIRRPVKLGAMSIPWFAGSNQYASFSRNLLVVSQGYCSSTFTEGFYVIDVRDPAVPQLLSSVTQKRTSGTACHNGYVFVGDYNQGMQIWDITNPARPVMVTDQGFVRCSQTWSMEYHGDHALHNEVGGLELWRTPIRPQAPEGEVGVGF